MGAPDLGFTAIPGKGVVLSHQAADGRRELQLLLHAGSQSSNQCASSDELRRCWQLGLDPALAAAEVAFKIEDGAGAELTATVYEAARLTPYAPVSVADFSRLLQAASWLYPEQETAGELQVIGTLGFVLQLGNGVRFTSLMYQGRVARRQPLTASYCEVRVSVGTKQLAHRGQVPVAELVDAIATLVAEPHCFAAPAPAAQPAAELPSAQPLPAATLVVEDLLIRRAYARAGSQIHLVTQEVTAYRLAVELANMATTVQSRQELAAEAFHHRQVLSFFAAGMELRAAQQTVADRSAEMSAPARAACN